MDFLQLKYCTEAAKYQNFTRAAEACYVSQSVISVQIGKLEAELGIRKILAAMMQLCRMTDLSCSIYTLTTTVDLSTAWELCQQLSL